MRLIGGVGGDQTRIVSVQPTLHPGRPKIAGPLTLMLKRLDHPRRRLRVRLEPATMRLLGLMVVLGWSQIRLSKKSKKLKNAKKANLSGGCLRASGNQLITIDIML